MLRSFGEQALHLDGAAGDLVSKREIFERLALPPEVRVFGASACAEQDFQVDDGGGADQAALNILFMTDKMAGWRTRAQTLLSARYLATAMPPA